MCDQPEIPKEKGKNPKFRKGIQGKQDLARSEPPRLERSPSKKDDSQSSRKPSVPSNYFTAEISSNPQEHTSTSVGVKLVIHPVLAEPRVEAHTTHDKSSPTQDAESDRSSDIPAVSQNKNLPNKEPVPVNQNKSESFGSCFMRTLKSLLDRPMKLSLQPSVNPAPEQLCLETTNMFSLFINRELKGIGREDCPFDVSNIIAPPGYLYFLELVEEYRFTKDRITIYKKAASIAMDDVTNDYIFSLLIDVFNGSSTTVDGIMRVFFFFGDLATRTTGDKFREIFAAVLTVFRHKLVHIIYNCDGWENALKRREVTSVVYTMLITSMLTGAGSFLWILRSLEL